MLKVVISGANTPTSDLAMTGFGDFIFQAMFAATGATIVSGAVAERVKLSSFHDFRSSLRWCCLSYSRFWHWGGGVLAGMGIQRLCRFYCCSRIRRLWCFACVMVLGPRKGKYTESGIKPIPAHSFPLAAIGVFLLMFGWYGFNGGSVLSADPTYLGLVFTTTTLGATAGAFGAIATSWFLLKKPDLSMASMASLPVL